MGVRGLGLILYGSEGVGKTGLALQFGLLGPVTCLSVDESGYEDLEIVGEVPDTCTNHRVTNWETLRKKTREVKEGTLVVDALTGVQRKLFDFVCRTQYDGRWDGKDSFTSYYKGQRVDSPPVLMQWLDDLDELRHKGVHVILIGHMVTTTLPNTLGGDFLSHVIEMDDGDKGGCRSCVMKWAQAVLFMNIDISITRSTETSGGIVTKGKGNDEDNRLIYTTKSPGHAAKNRLHLPGVINMGTSPKEAFTNLWKSLPQAYKDLM